MPNPVDEPSISLPAGAMVGLALGVPAAMGLVWWLVARVGPWSDAFAWAGVCGAAVTAAATLAGTLIIGPWKRHPVHHWMSLWLAGVVVRLLLAPVLAYLLYSAAPLGLAPFGLSIGLTYLLTILSEAALLSRHLQRVLPI